MVTGWGLPVFNTKLILFSLSSKQYINEVAQNMAVCVIVHYQKLNNKDLSKELKASDKERV